MSLVCPLEFRYGREEMKEVFSERRRLERILEVEATLADVHAGLGTIPKRWADEIRAKATPEHVRLERVKEIESEIRHDLMAVVKALDEVCDGEAGGGIHVGATSYDILDTATALQLKEASAILDAGLAGLEDALASLAREHRNTVMAGRTHGQQAIPITFGLKCAVFALEVRRHRERLRDCGPRVFVGKMSGAVGSGAAFGDGFPEVEAQVMERLGLGVEEGATQIVQRDRHCEFLSVMANIDTSLEKFATEVRTLMRTELGEVGEEFDKEAQVGSSTMPHKRNPITAENITGLARLARAFLAPEFENAVQWGERDLCNSAGERFIIPHMVILTDDIVAKCAGLFSRLSVDAERMDANLRMTGGTVMAEALMLALVKGGMGRQLAHETIRRLTMEHYSGGGDFFDIVRADTEVRLRIEKGELEKVMDPAAYAKNAGLVVDRVLARLEEGLPSL